MRRVIWLAPLRMATAMRIYYLNLPEGVMDAPGLTWSGLPVTYEDFTPMVLAVEQAWQRSWPTTNPVLLVRTLGRGFQYPFDQSSLAGRAEPHPPVP